jgi:hypothetical protein
LDNFSIRSTTGNDIQFIDGLYPYPHKRLKVLNWMLMDPADSDRYRSFVAHSRSGEVIGHIGYVKGSYVYGDNEFIGIHPIEWAVSAKHRRESIGKQLMDAVFDLGDFSLIIGGSTQGQIAFPHFGYEMKVECLEYEKIIKAGPYMRSIKGNLKNRIFARYLLMKSFINRSRSKPPDRDVSLRPYQGERIYHCQINTDIIYSEPNESDIDHFCHCPSAEGYAFTAMQGDSPLGIVMCYLKQDVDRIVRGRIVHISFLGNDPDLWSGVIEQTLRFLIQKQCAVISTLAAHPLFRKALEQSGFVFNRYRRPVFIRDPRRLFVSQPTESWHLTYREGDLGYRGL